LFSSSENIKKLRELVEELPIRDFETFEMVEILKLTLEHTTDGYWDWNMVSNYEYLSPGFKKQLGYNDDEMENHPSSWQKLIFKEDLEKMEDELNKHIESKGKEQFKVIARFTHKSGDVVEILCRGSVIRWDDKGNPVRMIGTHIDITNL